MNLDKMIYKRAGSSKEPQIIEFSIPQSLTIGEYKRVCKRMAAALGYNHSTIEEYFGKDKDSGNKNQLKLLFG